LPWIDEETKKAVKEIDLLTYLQQNEPHELVKSKYGTNEYRTKTHGSLVISNGLWRWNRGKIGGKSALDFLMNVRGMGFVEAVEAVLGSRSIVPAYSAVALSVESTEQAPLKADFKLPDAAFLPSNAVSYLQKRGISPEIINRCLSLGIIYESRNRKNVIFVGMDENSKPRFACRRGIGDDFKADVSGSDKRYSFSLLAEDPANSHLMVFEAPIDLLSEATLQYRGDVAGELILDAHRLSLGGTSDVALMSFLERHLTIEQISLCLDADEAGQTATRKIAAKLAADTRFEHIRVRNCPPQDGAKDYNEALLRIVDAEREQKQKQPSRRYEAAI